jgi:hypothetical protein
MGKLKYTLFRSLVFVPALVVLAFSTDSCHKPGVPIYLHIDSPSVVSVFAFGSASSNISSVWATSGSSNVGAYEMPVDIPILASGNVPIAISAGIYDNGIVSAPVQYPFYAPDTFTITNAVPGHVYHHRPVYSYYAFTQVALNADFESSNLFTNVTYMTNLTDSNVFQGTKSGGIIVSPAADSITAYQTVPKPINTNGRQAYLELNYRANNPNVFCDVGVIATLFSGGTFTDQQYLPKITLTPKGYWNKIYLDFNNEIGGNPTYSFQVYFTVYHSQGVQDTMFIDNVKLLYFH